MMRFILSGLAWLLVICSFGQNITRLEYFVDTDPGHGNGISVPITPAATLTDFTFDVPLGSFSAGIHVIYFRMQDENLIWGQTFSNVIYKEVFAFGDPLQDIVKAEYFIDTDPGIGNGTDIPLAPNSVLTDLSIAVPLNSISPGVHVIYVRLKNDNNSWSQTFSSVIYKEAVALGDLPPDIIEAEYFVDTDPGFGNGTDIPFTPGANLTDFNFTVPLNSLSNGVHVIYVRLKNENDAWSHTFSSVVYKEAFVAGDLPPDIVEAEYFLDTDPGFGEGTNVPISPGATLTDFSFTVPLDGVSAGVHVIYTRLKNSNNAWSHSYSTVIFKESVLASDPVQDIVKAEYFIDADPGFGNGTNIPITPGATITDLTFSVPLGSVSNGVHLVYTRLKNANNTWSATHASAFYKDNLTGLTPTNITKLEYFVDTDPGIGNGVNVPVTPGVNLTDVTFAIDASVLVDGQHKVYIRAKGADNRWGMVLVKNFSVCDHPGTTLNPAANISANAFELSWAVVPGSSNYQLDVSTDNFNTFVGLYNAVSIASNTTTVTGVPHASTYQVRVRAVATCASVHSNVITVSTPLSYPTSQPSNLQFNFITGTGFTATYNAASGSPTGYLAIRKEDSSPAFVPDYNTSYTIGQVLPDGIVAYRGPNTSFIESGLTPNTLYYYDIFSYNEVGALIAYRPNPHEGSVRTHATEPAAQPTTMVFSTVTDTGYTVEFTPSAGGADGYIAIRATGTAPVAAPVDGTTYTTTMGSNTVVYQGSAASFTQSGLTSNTHYYYAIFAFNGVGAGINYVELLPLTGDVTTPITPPSAQPTNLQFDNVGTSSFDVSYTASGSASGYLAIRKDGSSSDFVPQTNVAYTLGEDTGDGIVAYVGPNTSFQESSLAAATAYLYDIFAYNSSGPLIGYRGFSPLEGSVTTLVEAPTAAPTGLVLSGITTTSVQVDFVPSASSTASLVVRSSSAASSFLPVDGTPYALGDVVGDVTIVYNGSGGSFTETGLLPGIEYYYYVFAYNGTGQSSSYFDAGISASKITVSDKPVLLATSSVDQTGFTVNWSAVTGAASYRIDVSTDNFVTRIAGFDDATSATNSVAVTGLQSGVEYVFRVRAINASGASVNSDAGAQITIPATPVLHVLAVIDVGQTGFPLSWDAVTGASEYRLDVSADQFASYLAGFNDKPLTATSAVLTGLTPGIPYQYRVRSRNTAGTSPSSAAGEQLTLPATPVNSPATSITTRKFVAKWVAVVPPVNEYRVDVTKASDDFSPSIPAYDDVAVIGNTELLIENLTPGESYKFRVRAVNATGPSPSSTPSTVTTVESGAGLILGAFEPPAEFSAQVEFPLSVTGVADFKFTLFHRKLSEATFQSIATAFTSNSTYQVIIAPTMADELGVEIYVRVENTSGNETTTSRKIIRRAVPAAGIKIPFEKSGGKPSDYEIFSIPYKLENNTIASIFEEMGAYDKTKWRLVRYQGGQNVDFGDGLNSIELGKGYWFNSKVPANVTFSGGHAAEVTETTHFIMTLEPGWNQIGNPFPFDIDWGDILGLPSNSTVSADIAEKINVFNAAGGHLLDESDDLKTGGGGFVHNDSSSPVPLSLPASLKGTFNAGGRTRSPRSIDTSILDDEKWLVPISANIGGISGEIMGLGMHPKATATKDMYDQVVVPHFLNYIELYTYHEEFFTPRFSKDVVPTSVQKSWDLTFESNVESESVQLYWPSSDLGHGPAKLYLVDLTVGRWIDMKTSSSYTFKRNGLHRFRVAFAIDEEHLDLAVNMMGVPYPNPFAGHVTIPFAVHKAPARVNIVIYDAMGRKVGDLVNAEYEKGIHEVTWDGTTAGASLPAGMYFCRMLGDGMIMTERIIKK